MLEEAGYSNMRGEYASSGNQWCVEHKKNSANAEGMKWLISLSLF